MSGALKSIATGLIKISNDLRHMNSGPISGLGEIVLPALRHRVQLTAEAEVEGRDADDELRSLIQAIEVPRS